MSETLNKIIIKKLFDADKRIEIYDENNEYVDVVSHTVLLEVSDYYKKFIDTDFADNKSKLVLPFEKKLITFFISWITDISEEICDNNMDTYEENNSITYNSDEVILYSKIVYLLDYLSLNNRSLRKFSEKYMGENNLKSFCYDEDKHYYESYQSAIDPILILLDQSDDSNKKLNDDLLGIILEEYYYFYKRQYNYLGSLFYIHSHENFEMYNDFHIYNTQNKFKRIKLIFAIYFEFETIYNKVLSDEYIMMCWFNLLEKNITIYMDKELFNYIKSLHNEKYNDMFNKLDDVTKEKYNNIFDYDKLSDIGAFTIAPSTYSYNAAITHYISPSLRIVTTHFYDKFEIYLEENEKKVKSDLIIFIEGELSIDVGNNVKISDYLPIEITCNKKYDILLVFNVVRIGKKETIDYMELKNKLLSEISYIDNVENYKIIYEKINDHKNNMQKLIRDKSSGIINFPEEDQKIFDEKNDHKEDLLDIIKLGLYYNLNSFKTKYSIIFPIIFSKIKKLDVPCHMNIDANTLFLQIKMIHNNIILVPDELFFSILNKHIGDNVNDNTEDIVEEDEYPMLEDVVDDDF